MLLARKGYRVLIVDRATFPSDTISTHVVQPRGVSALSRWGLLNRLAATGCPPIHTYDFDFGPFVISGSPGTAESPVSYCPRRTVLDKLLVDGAAEAGAEIREGFSTEELIFDNGRVCGIKGHTKNGEAIAERASIVIGADGRNSVVAAAVEPEQYHEKPQLLAAYYSYWSGVPTYGRFETFVRPHRGMAAAETHDNLTLVIVGWPFAEFDANKKDVEGNYLKVLDLAPEFADRVRRGKRETPIAGASLPNFFRKPYGPGWALVGDAGYNKDPITAQGITDAFEDAERCVNALDRVHAGSQSFDSAMEEHRRARDEHALPMYEFTCQLASLEPPPLELQRLLGALPGNPAAMRRFAQMNAGTISPAEFFSRESIGEIMSRAADGG
jgi:2-polyprenyl-6-methoxyphenol hydroxylase-like FAD-dependent oxidoreductase